MDNLQKRDVVEAILITSDKKILLQKKTVDYPMYPGGYWSFFGGEVDEGETIEQTLVRELKEELNFEAKKFDLIDTKDYSIAGKQGKRFIFAVEFDGKLSDIILTEGAGFAFFEFSELEEAKIVPLVYDSLKEYLKSLKN